MLFKDKIFGTIEITEPVALELIQTPQMQRLEKIHQYGVYYLFLPNCATTRFEHSLGVYWILKEFGAELKEQLVGLLHDLSHSVFSHVIDYLYDNTASEDYQDKIHHRFFRNNEISRILERYHINPDDIADLKNWPLADCPLPNVCADRLQYTLADAITIGKIDAALAQKFIQDLFVQSEKFVFKTPRTALEFAELSLWMCKNFWHSNWGAYSFFLMVKILKAALEESIIGQKDLMTDDESMLNKLEDCHQPKILNLLETLKNFQKDAVVEDKTDYDVRQISKMRVIDPWVEVDHQLVRVTALFPDFKKGFAAEGQRVSQPRYLKYLKENI